MDNDKHTIDDVDDITGIDDNPSEENAETRIDISDAGESASEVHRRIMDRADELWTWWQDNITESEIDRDMIANKQWSAEALAQRGNRITLTVNKLVQYVERIMGDILQNPTNIKYRAITYNAGPGTIRGKKADKEYDIAEVRSSIAKDIEIKSNAQSWYNRAAQQMCDGGFGWLRVDAISDEYGQPQLEISGVVNPSNAMIDFSGNKPDFSDARDGFVFTWIPVAVYKKMFPGQAVTDFSTSQMNSSGYRWAREQMVAVAEYWERIPRKKEEIIDEMNAGNMRPPTHKVVWRRLSGTAILEGGAKGVTIPFTTIPLVLMFGSEVILSDGRRIITSVHRHARDAQKDGNYWRSAMSEMVAEQANQPWIGTEEMFEGNESEWETANVVRPSRLVYKVDPSAPQGRPEKERPQDIPAAAMQLYLTATQDLNQAIGMRSDFSGEVRGDESGRAILAKERQDATGKYSFTHGRDNAVKRVGELLQQGIRRVYKKPQEVRIYNPDESVDYVDIQGDEFDSEMECYVEAGPSYATQRIETVNVLMDLAQAMPQQLANSLDIILENLDFPAAKRVAERIRRSINPAVLGPNERADLEKEKAEAGAPETPPDPNLVLTQQIEAAKAAAAEARKGTEALKAKQEELQLQQEALKLQTEQTQVANENQIKDMVAKAIAELIKETGVSPAIPQQPLQS